MDIKDKVVNALMTYLKPEYVRLDNGDGISGCVVSRKFEKFSGLDRQKKIDEVLRNSELTPNEQSEVVMIAALTPREFDSIGARIRVQRVQELAGGALELQVDGSHSDAEYVRESLKNHKGIETTEPKQVRGPIGALMSFRAHGGIAEPLTKAEAIRLIRKNRYIEVLPNA